MANVLLTNDIIAKQALVEFKNNLILARMVNRQYQSVFNNTTGDTIRIRKPTRYTVRTGSAFSSQDINQRYVNLSITEEKGVDVVITQKELVLDLDSFSESVLRPAMITLANDVDSYLYGLSGQIYNAVGTAGTAPNSVASMNNAAAILDSFGVDRRDRFAMLSSFDAAALQNGTNDQFNEAFNKSLIFDGTLGRMAGFDVNSVQNTIRPAVSTLAVGARGTPLVNGASQSGSTLNTNGWTNSTTGILLENATFTIAGVYSVNPLTRQSTNKLQTFTMTADANSGASTGPAALSISPAIILTGPYQNVTNAPADDAAITVNEQHTINFGFYKEAFTLAMISYDITSDNGQSAYRKNMVDEDAGISLTMSRQYDINNNQDKIRFDILYGGQIFPEYATRIMGS